MFTSGSPPRVAAESEALKTNVCDTDGVVHCEYTLPWECTLLRAVCETRQKATTLISWFTHIVALWPGQPNQPKRQMHWHKTGLRSLIHAIACAAFASDGAQEDNVLVSFDDGDAGAQVFCAVHADFQTLGAIRAQQPEAQDHEHIL